MEKFTFKIYRENGALNSSLVFDAVEKGLINMGYTPVDSNEQIPVIWSVLWSGRMVKNRQVYLDAISKQKPILIIEVGNLKRNTTWRVSINNVNYKGIFGNHTELDINRANKLGIPLYENKLARSSEILITTQHEKSLQWQGMPDLKTWLNSTVSNIRKYSERKIVIRPHPRWNLIKTVSYKNTVVQQPNKIVGSYDDFDINYSYHCVINHNSGPTIQAACLGIPVVCHESSLAYPISNSLSNIENLEFKDRQEWFLKLCHTEWTIEEISKSIPFLRLHSEMLKFYN
jgi:hypothetical protein